MSATDRIVVVGAGMAGLRAVEALRRAGSTREIVVVGAEQHPPYDRPPLSKEGLQGFSGTAADWLAKVAFPRPAEGVSWRLGEPVRAADLAASQVRLESGEELPYAGLVVATGLRSRRLPIGAESPARRSLRTLDDAVALRARLRPGTDTLVIGGGFIGCEVACSATTLGCRVSVVEPREHCLELALLPELGALVEDYLRLHGIEVRTGRLVRELEIGSESYGAAAVAGAEEPGSAGGASGPGGGGGPGGPGAPRGATAAISAVLDDDTRLTADVVVESVGSIPNVEWLEGNGLDLSDGVLCDPRLRAGGRRGVVVVGDVARFANRRFDDVPRRVEHWCMPSLTSAYAAQTLLADLAGADDDRPDFAPLPDFWSDQLGLRLQSFGAPQLGDEVGFVSGEARPDRLEDGVVAHYLRAGRLVGVVLINGQPREYRPQRMLVDAASPPPPSPVQR